MKKRPDIQFKALLLLLVYLFSNSPSILFHHHHNLEIAAYEKATSCEKAIYYADKDSNCNHKAHLSKAKEKCLLCDNHTVSPHSFQACLIECNSNEFRGSYFTTSSKYYFQTPSTLSNRGPPTVSSFTV